MKKFIDKIEEKKHNIQLKIKLLNFQYKIDMLKIKKSNKQ